NARDVSERRQAGERYRSIFNNAIEGICQTTPDGHFIIANPALAQMLSYSSPAELLQQVRNIGTQVYADPQEREEFLRRIGRDGIVKGFECQAHRKDGSKTGISINARASSDASGKMVCY